MLTTLTTRATRAALTTLTTLTSVLYSLTMPSGLPGFLSEAEQQTLHALAEFTRATAPEV
eukprot:scaffold36497_cov67-Phaeocystis_antarctica.AAC.2